MPMPAVLHKTTTRLQGQPEGEGLQFDSLAPPAPVTTS